MDYAMYRLSFLTGVHFGNGTLDSTETTFRADTLFSALCTEAVKRADGSLEKLTAAAGEGRLILSDAFPYVGGTVFLPKPFLRIEGGKTQGDSSVKKTFKNMAYVPAESISDFVRGAFPVENAGETGALGHTQMKTQAAVRGLAETMPYRVRMYRFAPDGGLYFIAGCADKVERDLLEELLTGVSLSGIGGERSSGLGRFDFFRKKVPDGLRRALEDTGAPVQMTISISLPADDEMEAAVDGASFQLEKRSGFVESASYAPEQTRKRDSYLFASGSCFRTRFGGKILDVSSRGTHPVYRYAMPLFVGVRA